MRTLIVIVGLSSVQEKNLYQVHWLDDHGFRVDILTTHRHPSSITQSPAAAIEPIERGVIGRVRQLQQLLRANRGEIHHAELYPGGRFAWIYALFCRLRRVKLMVVERGDILYAQRRAYPLPIRLSLYACYRLADVVWYREPYQGEALHRWRVGRTFFLPNGVPLPPVPRDDRDVDFLWVNRLIAERHPEWFANALADLTRSRPVTAEILGFSSEHVRPDLDHLEQQTRAALASAPSCRLFDFSDPTPHYRRARFFVLPADVVFGNFALLEAMSYGVVPIVSKVDATDLLVEDGENGIVVDHTPDGLRRGMEAALTLDDEQWRKMSKAARQTIEDRFSLEQWGTQLLREYDALTYRRAPTTP